MSKRVQQSSAQLFVFGLVGLLMCCVHTLQAQTNTSGAIEGYVYELGTRVPIANATVTVRNVETGLERTIVTDTSGKYFVGILKVGTYSITGTHPDYEAVPSSVGNVLVRITDTSRVTPPPIELRRRIPTVAGTTPTTPPATTTPPTTRPPATTTPPTTPAGTPTAAPVAADEAPVEQLVNTTNAARGQSFTRRQLLALPLPGIRSFDDLALLAPGVAPPPLAIGRSVGPGLGPGVGTSGQFSVNGLRSRANNFTIDGSDNNDEEVGVRRQGFTTLIPQPIESVQEYQITTLLPEPQFGRNMGAQVNAVSRSGGSEFHGTLYGFFTDRRLKARDAFDLTGGPASFPLVRRSDSSAVLFNGAPLAPANPVNGEDPYTRGQYGLVLGGPLVSERTQFFFSFEHQDINASRESHFAVPTIEERGIFFSGASGLNATSTKITTLPNLFPTSERGNAFLSLFPFPNNPRGPYGPNTFTDRLPASADGNVFSFRLDHTFNAFGQEHSLMGRYNFTDDDTFLPVTGEALFSSLRPKVRTQNLSLFLISNLSARAVNQARFSYGRTRLRFDEVRNPYLLPAGTGLNQEERAFLLNAPLIENVSFTGGPATFRTVPGRTTESLTGPLGQVRVSGYSPIGVDVFNFPQRRTNHTYQYADTLIYSFGNQRLTAGFDLRQKQLNSFLGRNFRPLAVFSGALDIPNAGLLPNANLRPFSTTCTAPTACFYFGIDFMALGAPTGFFQTQALTTENDLRLRFWENNFFLSHQWRVRNNFTLTVGGRYEYNTVPTEADRRIESSFTTPEVTAIGLDRFLNGRRKIYAADKNNFAPYVSFAWDPYGNGRTVVRGGYGIYYDQILGAVVSQSRNVFPSYLTLDLSGTTLAGNQIVPSTELGFLNPATLATSGTLNTYNQARFGNPADLIRNLNSRFTGFSAGAAGAAFVLPASDLVTPYAQHWSLTVEQQLLRDVLVSAAYVGTRGVHLLRFATPNLGPNSIPQVTSVTSVGNRPVFNGVLVAPSLNNSFTGRPLPLLGSFTSIESDANSNYHSLQLQALKRFAGGFQFTAAYTWSHAIDEVSDLFDLAGTLVLPQDSFNRRAERGDANFDVRHRFVYSAVWDVPLWRENRVLGGWQLASIGTFQTGQPYSVLSCCDSNLDGNLTERGISPTLADIGTAGRNTFRAPGIATIDLAVNKFFRFSERHSLEFRSEFFNLFNRTHFGIPVHQLFFGGVNTNFRPLDTENPIYVDTRVPARTIQFGLRYNF
jgi:hypothetical protein